MVKGKPSSGVLNRILFAASSILLVFVVVGCSSKPSESLYEMKERSKDANRSSSIYNRKRHTPVSR